jgi:hypothetical protein
MVALDWCRQIGEKKVWRTVAPMPTLIRFVIVLLFLAGIAYGAMFALTVFVEPREKEVSQRIPARDLFGE